MANSRDRSARQSWFISSVRRHRHIMCRSLLCETRGSSTLTVADNTRVAPMTVSLGLAAFGLCYGARHSCVLHGVHIVTTVWKGRSMRCFICYAVRLLAITGATMDYPPHSLTVHRRSLKIRPHPGLAYLERIATLPSPQSCLTYTSPERHVREEVP